MTWAVLGDRSGRGVRTAQQSLNDPRPVLTDGTSRSALPRW